MRQAPIVLPRLWLLTATTRLPDWTSAVREDSTCHPRFVLVQGRPEVSVRVAMHKIVAALADQLHASEGPTRGSQSDRRRAHRTVRYPDIEGGRVTCLVLHAC